MMDLECKPAQALHWIHVGVFLMISLFLLFAHGCHGDEDTELFGQRSEIRGQKSEVRNQRSENQR